MPALSWARFVGPGDGLPQALRGSNQTGCLPIAERFQAGSREFGERRKRRIGAAGANLAQYFDEAEGEGAVGVGAIAILIGEVMLLTGLYDDRQISAVVVQRIALLIVAPVG